METTWTLDVGAKIENRDHDETTIDAILAEAKQFCVWNIRNTVDFCARRAILTANNHTYELDLAGLRAGQSVDWQECEPKKRIWKTITELFKKFQH